MFDDLIRFTVPVALGQSTRWLQPDGTLGDKEGALECVLAPFPTTDERSRIRRLSHEYAGGVVEWVQTEQAIDVMRRKVQDGFEALGEHEEPGADLIEHNMVLAELVEVRELVAFQATWEVLWRGGEGPWAKIADLRMPAIVADALRSAFEREIQGVLEGNGLSSAG